MAGSLTIDNINGKVISSSPVATESQVIGVGHTTIGFPVVFVYVVFVDLLAVTFCQVCPTPIT